MATLWKNVFVEVPLDNDIVWIVRLPFFDTPIQAKFSEGPPGSFTWADSNASDQIIPLENVFKWRPV